MCSGPEKDIELLDIIIGSSVIELCTHTLATALWRGRLSELQLDIGLGHVSFFD